jgi:3-(3-hydroxy-phenyl)propionate hydroxylase
MVLLDEVIGSNFAIIAWGSNPKWGLKPEQIAAYEQLGVKFIQVLPAVQLKAEREVIDGVITVGDYTNRLKTWFGLYPASVVILRPDRFVAAATIPQTLEKAAAQVLYALRATPVIASVQASAGKVA